MADEKIATTIQNGTGGDGGDVEDGRVFVVESNRRDELIKLVLLIILIVVFPPAAVAVHANECNMHVFISLILVFFFMIPSYIHAIWYCFFRKPTLLTIS